jgi:hypothetical protein
VALIFLVFLPLLAALLCWIKPIRRGAWAITVVCLGATSALAFVVTARVISNQMV